jgi:hypothetical protein
MADPVTTENFALRRTPVRRAASALLFSMATGVFLSANPSSLVFWDAGRTAYWRNRYVEDERPREFAKIESLIPQSARVASTDFVHPRYTHFKRSYDYSAYARQVAGYEDRIPDDTDYIVIDTQHPYSKVRSPKDVRELQREPDRWELLEDQTNGYFIILRRRDRSGR